MKQFLTQQRSSNASSFFLFLLSSLSILCLQLAPICSVGQARHLSSRARRPDTDDLGSNDLEYQGLVNELKAKILKQMGLSEPPSAALTTNTSSTRLARQRIREFMDQEMIRNGHAGSANTDGGDDNDSAAAVTTSVFYSTQERLAVKPTAQPSSRSDLSIVTFKTDLTHPDVPYHELLVKSATLRMRISRQRDTLRQHMSYRPSLLNVSVYWIQSPDSTATLLGNTTPILLQSFTLTNSTQDTVEVDVGPMLSPTIESADHENVFTFGIRVQTLDLEEGHRPGNLEVQPTDRSVKLNSPSKTLNNHRRRGHSVATSSKTLRQRVPKVVIARPVLEVSKRVVDLRRARSRRQTDEDNCQGNLCCRHSIYVSFHEIGWDSWVMAPEGYEAHYCKGSCPKRYKSASTFSGIKSMLHCLSPSVVPEPTCAPTGYTGARLLYINALGEMEEESYAELVVTGCRCL